MKSRVWILILCLGIAYLISDKLVNNCQTKWINSPSCKGFMTFLEFHDLLHYFP